MSVNKAMNIRDFKKNHTARSIKDLQTILSRRYLEEENWFLLCAGGEDDPCMTLAVRGDLSTLHYMRSNEDAGFISVGGELDLEEDVTFKMTETDDFPVRGDAVI